MKSRTYLFPFIFFVLIFHIFLVTSAAATNRIMPLGDSITKGESGSSNDTGYRRSLYFSLIGPSHVDYSPNFVGSQNTGIPNDFDKEHEGHGAFTSAQIAAAVYGWLTDNPAGIVLLHIGTNGLEESAADVAAILDEIDRFEDDNAVTIWVILARIINRSCITDLPTSCPESVTTMNFNTNVANMAQDRILAGDKIIIVDMEYGDVKVAVIDYHLTTDIPPGDMLDDLHPFDTGYDKMAALWFSALMDILPLANAGPDQNVSESATATLDASSSTDPKNGTLTYQWVQTTGPDVQLSDAQAEKPTFVAPSVGPGGEILTFTLTVTDEDELVSTDTMNVVVAKIAPQANAGPDQTVNESATVTLDASGSVGVGLSYQWAQTGGTPVVDLLPDGQAEKPTFVAPTVGLSGETLTFELTVTDDDGVESTDTVDIAVKILPQADAGPDQNVDEFDQVTLDASGSVAAGALSYQWTQAAGTAVGLSDAQAVQPTFTAPDVAPGSETLTFRLTVTDDDDLESTDTVNIIVHNPTSSGSGGGGGGGCFIAIAANSPPIALSGNVLDKLSNRFTMLSCKRRMPEDISRLTPRAAHAATLLAMVITLVALISSCLAITLRKSRKRWLKL